MAELVGRTPLIQLTGVTRDLPKDVRVWAKLEGFNPGGSVKDRPALRMLQEGLRTGALRPGKVVIDSTSGNTGIALAMMGAALGYPVHLVIPGNVSVERRQIIEAYGAVAIESDPLEGSDGAIRHCREVIARDPDRYFKPDQYFNPANPLAHYETTGPELWEQTEGKITHFLAGIGTSGTVMGTGRFLKEKNQAVQILAVEPDDSFHGIEGLKHMESSIVPGIYKEAELDGKVPVGTEEAYDMVYRLGREDGLLVGQSAGGACWAALEVASKLDQGEVVTVFPDFGEKYLSTTLWAGWADIGPPVRANG
ncbi:MAG: cysteine synthase family protein [Candidatus Binatia bacterium]|nr:cysteine synthase family protein [Candidatus Binatia bacterium]